MDYGEYWINGRRRIQMAPALCVCVVLFGNIATAFRVSKETATQNLLNKTRRRKKEYIYFMYTQEQKEIELKVQTNITLPQDEQLSRTRLECCCIVRPFDEEDEKILDLIFSLSLFTATALIFFAAYTVASFIKSSYYSYADAVDFIINIGRPKSSYQLRLQEGRKEGIMLLFFLFNSIFPRFSFSSRLIVVVVVFIQQQQQWWWYQ